MRFLPLLSLSCQEHFRVAAAIVAVLDLPGSSVSSNPNRDNNCYH